MRTAILIVSSILFGLGTINLMNDWGFIDSDNIIDFSIMALAIADAFGDSAFCLFIDTAATVIEFFVVISKL